MPDLTDEAVNQLLPGIQPNLRVPVGVNRNVFDPRFERLSALQSRILRWTTTLQAQIESERWDYQLPGFQYATFGFVPVAEIVQLPAGVISYGGYVFGVAIELEASGENPVQQIEGFSYAGATLARVLNWRTMEPHIPHPTFPSAGTGACYAHSRKGAISPADADGVLTAGHVVRGKLGSPVTMSTSSGWKLGDRGSCKIDAALIVLAGSLPSSLSSLAVQANPVASSMVEFYGEATKGLITARITHTQIHSTYLSDEHPMRVFFDKPGIAGDSGALVLEQGTKTGVGIYMGSYPIPPTGGGQPVQEGGAQALSQAQHVLQLDLYV